MAEQGTRGAFFPRRVAILIALALAAGVIVGLIAAFAAKHGTPTFQSAAVVEIDQPTAMALSPDDGVFAKLSRLRYKYAGLLNTEIFATPIAQQTHLPVGAVLTELYPIVNPSSLTMVIVARTHDRTQAQQLASAGAQYLVDYTNREQAGLNAPPADKVSFTIVTQAAQATKTAPTSQRVALVGLGTFAFVAAGTLAFGFLWRRDRT